MSDLQRTETGWTLVAPTITQMVYRAIKQMADVEEPDAALNIETHLVNVTLVAETSRYDLDVGHELHLNIGRWSRLVREYLDRDSLYRFIAQSREIIRGEARDGATTTMFFRDPIRHPKKHRYGGCLLAATFNSVKRGKPTLTFYSRTTYISYVGILDAAIAHIMAREIGSVDDIQFRWHLPSMQLHAFKSLPWFYRKASLNHKLEKLERNRHLIPSQPVWWRYAMKWHCNIVDRIEAEGLNGMKREKYGSYKRIFRRWLETKGKLKTHIPPSLLIQDLTFDKAE